MVEAHDEQMCLRIVVHYPAHEPREEDPHYHLFDATRRRLKRLGALICWRCGATKDIELHHDLEFSLATAIDVEKFRRLNPQIDVPSDEAFLEWLESEGNLLALCVKCHRGEQGIHFLPYPVWKAGRYQRDGHILAEKA